MNTNLCWLFVFFCFAIGIISVEEGSNGVPEPAPLTSIEHVINGTVSFVANDVILIDPGQGPYLLFNVDNFPEFEDQLKKLAFHHIIIDIYYEKSHMIPYGIKIIGINPYQEDKLYLKPPPAERYATAFGRFFLQS